MDILRLSLLSDYRARLVWMFPRVTAAQLMRFDDLVLADRLVGDDGQPTKALEAWVQAVMAGLPPDPRPVPGSNAIEVAR